jgi:ATP-dependent protease ClpP protease subunit
MDLFLYQAITKGDAPKIISELRAARNAPISVRINSPGGSVFEGYAIFNALKAYGGTVNVSIDALAASVAALIAMAGRKISIARNAMIMIHSASQDVESGTPADMRRSADLLEKINLTMAAAFAQRTGQSQEKILSMINAGETWLTAEQAKDMGFVDEITEGLAIAANLDLSRFKNLPPALRQRIDPRSAKILELEGRLSTSTDPKEKYTLAGELSALRASKPAREPGNEDVDELEKQIERAGADPARRKKLAEELKKLLDGKIAELLKVLTGEPDPSNRFRLADQISGLRRRASHCACAWLGGIIQ